MEKLRIFKTIKEKVSEFMEVVIGDKHPYYHIYKGELPFKNDKKKRQILTYFLEYMDETVRPKWYPRFLMRGLRYLHEQRPNGKMSQWYLYLTTGQYIDSFKYNDNIEPFEIIGCFNDTNYMISRDIQKMINQTIMENLNV